MPPVKKATPARKATPDRKPATGKGSSRDNRAKPDLPDPADRARAAIKPRTKEERDLEAKALAGDWDDPDERRRARRQAASERGNPDIVIR